jgi:hypothetical protein
MSSENHYDWESMLVEIRTWRRSITQESAKYSVNGDEDGLTQLVQQGESTHARHLVWDEGYQYLIEQMPFSIAGFPAFRLPMNGGIK